MIKFYVGLGTAIFTFIVIITTALVRLWVILKLWAWFLTPLGLEVIPAVNLFGILLIINLVRGVNITKDTPKENKTKIDENTDITVAIDKLKDTLNQLGYYFKILITPLLNAMLILLIGWIVKHIFM